MVLSVLSVMSVSVGVWCQGRLMSDTCPAPGPPLRYTSQSLHPISFCTFWMRNARGIWQFKSHTFYRSQEIFTKISKLLLLHSAANSATTFQNAACRPPLSQLTSVYVHFTLFWAFLHYSAGHHFPGGHIFWPKEYATEWEEGMWIG